MIVWKAWTDITEEIAVAMNKGSHDDGLRKQHFGCHSSWDCWYLTLLAVLWVLHCIDVGSAY
jgi:hypothetical protein